MRCWLLVFVCFLFSIRIYNLRIYVSKHPNSIHQLLLTAAEPNTQILLSQLLPTDNFLEKLIRKKSRTKKALVSWNTWDLLSICLSLAILVFPTFSIHVRKRVNLASEIASHCIGPTTTIAMMFYISQNFLNFLKKC
jgi:hypothetical protein